MVNIRVPWLRSRSVPRVQSISLLAAIPLLVALLLPTIFNPWGFSAFELPKVLLLWLAAALALTGAIFLVKPNPGRSVRQQLRSQPWLGPVAALAAVLLLSTLFSANRFESFWGSYERRQGLLTQFAVIGVFAAAVITLDTRTQVQRLWLALVWGSLPVVGYGLLQAAGVDPFLWQINSPSPMLSTIGRSNFLSEYLLLVIPLTLAAAAARANTHRLQSLVYAALFLAQVICLGLTGARSAWIGLAVASVTVLLGVVALLKPRHLLMVSLLAGAAATMALVIAWYFLGVETGLLANLTQHLRDAFDVQSGSSAARLAIWKATLKLIAQRPLLGYGPDSLHRSFLQVYPPELVYYEGRDIVIDRAHNLWLDMAASAGAAGVIALAWLCLAWVWMAWRNLKNAVDFKTKALAIALLAAVLGHLADMQFSFEVTTTAATFWLILALGIGLFSLGSQTPVANVETAQPRVSIPTIAVMAVVLALCGLLAVRQGLADHTFWRSQNETIPTQTRLADATEAVRLAPLTWRYRTGLAQIHEEMGHFSAAESQLALAGNLSRNDPIIWRLQADLYAAWAAVEPRQQPRAEAAYQRLINVAPTVASHYTRLGTTLAQKGDLSGSLQALERAIELDATDAVAYNNLAAVYSALGFQPKSDWALRNAQRWGVSATK